MYTIGRFNWMSIYFTCVFGVEVWKLPLAVSLYPWQWKSSIVMNLFNNWCSS